MSSLKESFLSGGERDYHHKWCLQVCSIKILQEEHQRGNDLCFIHLLLLSSSYDTCYYHYCHYYYCSFFIIIIIINIMIIIKVIITIIISIIFIPKIGNALCLCRWERLLPGGLRGTSHCGGEWKRNPGEILTFFGWDSDSHKPVRFLRDLTYRRLQRLV